MDAIISACVPAEGIAEHVVGIFEQPALRSTHNIQYHTSLGDHYPDDLDACTKRSELNIAACHSRLEVQMAGLLEEHPAVTAWARNYGLAWTVPYLHGGVWKRYEPDFVVRLFGRRDSGDAVYVMLEGKGQPDEESAAKQSYVEDYWISAVRNNGDLAPALRRWSFAQIPDSYKAYQEDRGLLAFDLNSAINRARQLLPATEGAR